jgi:hypothetical protein
MSDFFVKQNDTNPVIQATLIGPDGTPTNLTGCTVVFHMAEKNTLAIKVNAAATPDPDQTTNPGVVRYTWTGTDTDTVGDYVAEWQVTLPSGKIVTYPNVSNDTVKVTKELA